jgi:hypothetical protein
MQGAKHIQGLEHHQRQRALSNVRVFHLSIGFPTGIMTFFLWESNRAFGGLTSGFSLLEEALGNDGDYALPGNGR